MKFVLTLCIIALSWIAGYLAEPSLRPYILPKQGTGEGVVVVTPKIDLNKLTQSQLPERVTLMEDVPFISPSKLSITIPAGTSLKVKSVATGRVFVMLEDTSTTVGIPFEKTNLMEQVVAMIESGKTPPINTVDPTPVIPPAPTSTDPPPVTPPPAVTPPQPEPVVNPIPDPAVVTPPPPVTPPVPTPVVENPPTSPPTTPPSTLPPEPTPTPTPTTTPTPPPAPEDNFPNDGPAPLVAAGALNDQGLVQLMQQHIKSGALKTFTFEQVTDWKAGPTENINGTPVQTGTVTYTHQTIFGPKQLTAKAYMLRGRVLRWVWPESGLVLE